MQYVSHLSSSASRTRTHNVPKIVLINTIIIIINANVNDVPISKTNRRILCTPRSDGATKMNRRKNGNLFFTWLVSHFPSHTNSSALTLPQNQECVKMGRNERKKSIFLFVKFCGATTTMKTAFNVSQSSILNSLLAFVDAFALHIVVCQFSWQLIV